MHNWPSLTPTEVKLVAVLCDGALHVRDELVTCLNDELSTSLSTHLCNLRVKLRGVSRDVVAEFSGGRRCYRMVAHLDPVNKI